MEKYTVRSYTKMEGYPVQCEKLVEEMYFGTMDECQKWCYEQIDIKNLNFQIHHSLGACNYRLGIGSGMGIITWMLRNYDEHDYPSVRPWWTIDDVPPEVDAMCHNISF